MMTPDMNFKIRLTILAVLTMIITIIASGCAPDGGESKTDDGGDENGSEEVHSTGTNEVDGSGDNHEVTENSMSDITSNNDEADSTEPEPDEPFTPTQENPLAPPVDPAAGSENAPENEVSIAASFRGVGAPVALISGATVKILDSLDVQVTVVNNTDADVEYVFASGQKFDVVFYDPEGNLVYRWSEGMRFAQVVNTLVVTAGDSWSHEITIELPSGQNLLPMGQYTVKVEFVGTKDLAIEIEDITIESVRNPR